MKFGNKLRLRVGGRRHRSHPSPPHRPSSTSASEKKEPGINTSMQDELLLQFLIPLA